MYIIRPEVPEGTCTMANHQALWGGHISLFFPALLGTVILDLVRSDVIQDGSSWVSQEEEATTKGHCDHDKFGNHCTTVSV